MGEIRPVSTGKRKGPLLSSVCIVNIWIRRMIHKAKDLSPDQKMAIESLLGRSVAEDEAISVRTMASVSVPEWLQKSWESAKRLGLDRLSMEEIDAEIDAARKARRNRQQPLEQ